MIGGDFNTFLTLAEHKGRSSPSIRTLQDFNDFVATTALQSIDYQGSPFTWSDGRGLGQVWRRLDRYLCTSFCLDLFEVVQVQHLNHATSDHSPIFLECSAAVPNSTASFRYLDVWTTPRF